MASIVLFEDDPDISELVQFILETEGHEVTHHSTVENCVDAVFSAKPELILMDYMIPDDGGDNATKKIKANPDTCKVPVIMISAATNIHTIANEAGADGVIKKPFDIDDLISTVRRAVAV